MDSTDYGEMYTVPTEKPWSIPHKDVQRSLSALLPTLLEYLSIDEASRIHQQFLGSQWRPNSQVLWNGLSREEVQHWADAHGLQTLTTAMGPLMNIDDPLCPKEKKSKQQWSRYIKGASVIFAWYIAKGEKVTVLSPPPPQRFNPSGMTTYQAIEEPILKWAIASGANLRIEMVHPTVKGAEDFAYEVWPVNKTDTWVAAFGLTNLQKRQWRLTKMDPLHVAIRKAMEPSKALSIGTRLAY